VRVDFLHSPESDAVARGRKTQGADMSAPIQFCHAACLRAAAAAALYALAYPAYAQNGSDAAAPAVSAAAPAVAPRGSPTRALPDFSSLVQQHGAAVVNVMSTRQEDVASGAPDASDDPLSDFLRRFGIPNPNESESGPQVERDEGSGFIVSPDGYILTNAHVIEKATDVRVRLPDRREFTAKVIGADSKTDVAVLKIDARNLPTVKTGESSRLRPGEWVVAIGAPFGLENSVTAGVVSAKSRALGPENGIVPFIQTDVAVNPGNSGGPLFNLRGEVVGINSMIFSGSGGYQGVSFATPIDAALDVQQQLVKNGRVIRGRIGVAVQEVDAQLAQSFGLDRPRGALVSAVEKGGPAASAGLLPGDVIVGAQGQRIELSSELPSIVAHLRPGGRATLEVVREGKSRQLEVPVEELKEEASEPAVARAKPAATPTDEPHLGLGVRPLSPEEKREVELPNGLLIEHVSGPAAAAGLEAGDIILRAGAAPVSSLEDLQKATRNSRGTVALLVQREDMRVYVPLRSRSG
jgi:serine protease Do